MKKAGRKSSVGLSDCRSSIDDYSTKFSSPKFVKRVEALTDEQRKVIEKTGLGNLLLIPNQTMNRKLLLELMDKWSSARQAFIIPQGELTLTPLDVALIMGLRVKGDPVLLKDDEPFSDLEEEFGATPEKRKIPINFLESKLDSLGGVVNHDFLRTFLLFTFGVFLFPESSGNVDSRYLSFLRNPYDACKYAWGSAVLDEILMWLNKRKDSSTQSVGGCLTFLQIWSYEHIDFARPGLLDNAAFPRACRWENRKHNPRQSISFTKMFHELTDNQIIWTIKPSSYELEHDIIRETMEVQKDGDKCIGVKELLHTDMAVKLEYVSDNGTSDGTEKVEEYEELLKPCQYDLQNRSYPSVLDCTATSSSLQSADMEHLSTSLGSSGESPAGNVSWVIICPLLLGQLASLYLMLAHFYSGR
ncbi:hypothetical protein SAY86_005087 [Trapa natans]|uniref:Aminotransferase-like plant mobile domain-containing protein n=1 Tax=Trapa natans TaxID=22666 RepID=A0AAN7L2V1_TRANT|nr:hypothetical protein SAY86_005087 [Trapa natans]